ncbi:MAG: DUF2510 domain-containing protein [Acidimicrobiales bacterium]
MGDTPPPPPPTSPPPGWYPDPTTGVGFRWWDGLSWTEQTTAQVGPSPVGPPQVGEWMSELTRTVTDRAGHFFPMIVLLAIPPGLLNGVAVWYVLRNAVLVTNSDTGEFSFTNPGAGPELYAVVVISFLALVVATVYLAVAASRQARAQHDGAPEIWSASMLDGLRRLPRALGFTALVGGALVLAYVVMIVIGVAAPVTLILSFPVWLVGSFLIATRLSLGIIGASLAPAGVSALAASWHATGGRFWTVLGRLVLLVIISISLSLVTSVAATPFLAIGGGGASSPAGANGDELRLADLMGDNPATFAIGQLFSALGNGVATVVWAIGLTLLYRDLGGPVEERE